MWEDLHETYKGDPAYQYAIGVQNGTILAGEKIKIATKRHLDDLERQGAPNFPFHYDIEQAEKIIKFAELLKDVTSGEQFKPSPYQRFTLAMIQGWRHTNGATRFKIIFISMARTNGKTQLLATYTLFQTLFGEPRVNRQLAVSSIDISHTKPLYKYMTYNWNLLSETVFKKMTRDLGIEFNQNEMRIDRTATSMKRLSAKGSDSDGDHYTTGVIDEYHLFGQGERGFINAMTSGMVNNPNAQTFYISTAGYNPNVPMFEDYRRYAKQFEAGDFSNMQRDLVLIWEQDSTDEAYQPETWQKSNPLMELPSMKDILTEGLITERDAKVSQGKEADFLVKNMNMWQNAKENSFIDLKDLTASITEEFNVRGRQVYVGFDASQKNDDTSVAFVFPYEDAQGNQKYHLYQHSWVPTAHHGTIDAKESYDGINYRHEQERGFVTITRDVDGLIDQDEVFNWTLSFIEENDLQVEAFVYDQWGTGRFIRRLDEVREEWPIIPLRQGTHSLNEPTKFLQHAFIKHKVTMLDDQALQQGLLNAVVVSYNNGMKVDKNTNSQKIDTVDATVNALAEAMYHWENFTLMEPNKPKNFLDGKTVDEINEYYMNLTF